MEKGPGWCQGLPPTPRPLLQPAAVPPHHSLLKVIVARLLAAAELRLIPQKRQRQYNKRKGKEMEEGKEAKVPKGREEEQQW